MKHSEIEEIIEQRKKDRLKYANISQTDEETLDINGHVYKIIANERSAFDLTQFINAFNPIFTHFDYIVGDIGYGQLRLKGFYDDSRNVEQDLKKSAIRDYLYDYVNTGSNYFVLHNLEASIVKETKPKSNQSAKNKKAPNKKPANKRKASGRHNQGKSIKPKNTNKRRKFTIRQKGKD
ncbi:YutD family protein [Fructilactobacillus vespulae]|uniref:YutD family protein n=1 Tax=Fructilactobacillus vespulae TaxID=1249630 RepID=UPI0039B43D4D